MDREELFRRAVSEHREKIAGICRYYFQDPDDRSDAFQETLIRIWNNLSHFNGRSQLGTWIYRVTVNTCLGHIRSDRRRPDAARYCPDPVETGGKLPDTGAESDTADGRPEFFYRFLGRLGAADRMLVTLYLEELSTREMADVTGISEANVRVRIHRIKERIKQEWEATNHGT